MGEEKISNFFFSHHKPSGENAGSSLARGTFFLQSEHCD
jgi:hypothetical protein